MEITFGKFKGKSTPELIFKQPDYVKWLLQKQDTMGQMAMVQYDLKRRITALNAKPFVEACRNHPCTNPVTRLTGYHNGRDIGDDPYPWCDECSPYSQGANDGYLHELRTYGECVDFVDYSPYRRKADFNNIIRTFAEAKGLRRFSQKNMDILTS